ncbi:MAG: VWA domain-containing protein [Terracidiphilus sp.]
MALALGLPAMAVAGWAQLAPSPDAPPVSNAPAPPPDETPPAAKFRINVNLVDLFFTVKDGKGELVPHLTQQNCSVEENKLPQTLKTFVAETDLPLNLGILVDTSGSQERLLPMEKDAASQFIRQVLRAKDQAFVASFDVNVDMLQDYTNSPRLLTHALNTAEINTAGGNGSGIPGLGGGPVPISDPKGTVLYDAIYQAANDKMNQETGRKAMIILTDGEDEGSDHKIGEAIAAAEKNNVIVYVILLADRAMYWSQGQGYYGYGYAKRISDETGGRVIDVGNNGKKLEAAFQQIQDELRTQYAATYVPSNTKADGTFRKVTMSCHNDQGGELKVQLRKGYFAPSPDDSGQ